MRGAPDSNDDGGVDSGRKAPRWERKLRFVADDAFKGEVLDVSAVGLKVRVPVAAAVEVSERVLPGTLTFESGSHVRIKVRVARVTPEDHELVVLGLEIAEADKGFFDALPRLRRESGPLPKVE
ncbi:MAG: PilZ domain-containing protein [Archangiaceae bacterium]|nr:PilZ domain-containing protein [Archangiaceae bacterium]